MFHNLTQRLGGIFKKLRGQGHLSEANMAEGLREIRLALLEADVNFRVARDLLNRVQTAAMGQDLLRSITPAQQLVKIVQQELARLLGGEHQDLRWSPHPPTVVLLAGLQGSGKTTSAAKLALHLKKRDRSPLLVPADLSRPAAVHQLALLGRKAGVEVHGVHQPASPLKVAQEAVEDAAAKGYDPVLIDTAGRLHLDEVLMAELRKLRDALRPLEIFFVADSMTGQDAVTSVTRFHAELGLTGVIMTKLDGDSRGGAALSIRAVTGVPIRYAGVGEDLEDLEPFHPERMASRILGMGDVLTLVEKAQDVANLDEQRRLAHKLRRATFSLEDLRQQFRQVRKLGSLDQIMKLLPGMGSMSVPPMEGSELVHSEAIIDSMTPAERRDHTIINGSRRRRIASGSGTRVSDVNRLLKQFSMLHRIMKKSGGRMNPRALRKLRF
ncbi:MAG: signal recognition particle protein [Acidobacteriota bacterium]